MSENFFLKIELFFESKKNPKTILQAIRPELVSEKKSRSFTKISVTKEKLSIIIEAKDAVALRASFNSFFKAISLADRLLEGF